MQIADIDCSGRLKVFSDGLLKEKSESVHVFAVYDAVNGSLHNGNQRADFFGIGRIRVFANHHLEWHTL